MNLKNIIIVYTKKDNILLYIVITFLYKLSHLVIKGLLVAPYNILVRTHFHGKFPVQSSYLKLH